jgi:hypothetical protein
MECVLCAETIVLSRLLLVGNKEGQACSRALRPRVWDPWWVVAVAIGGASAAGVFEYCQGVGVACAFDMVACAFPHACMCLPRASMCLSHACETHGKFACAMGLQSAECVNGCGFF